MNRIDKLFSEKRTNILSVYFTAGYPEADSTTGIIKALEESGVDMIEIGVPFSDPVADGPVLQKSNDTALKNGMSLELLFRQLQDIRKTAGIPLLLMSYINPILRFGMEKFTLKCEETGIDGVILPDLPPEIYQQRYLSLFPEHRLKNVLLISPQTGYERIRKIDSLSRGFIYMVSSSSTTGIKKSFSTEQEEYFLRVREMGLSNPALIGFGISGADTFIQACKYANGAIIGSAFVKMLAKSGANKESIRLFINKIRRNKSSREKRALL